MPTQVILRNRILLKVFLYNKIFSNSLQFIRYVVSDERKKFKVPTFGKVLIRTGHLCDVNVQPVSPETSIDQNVAFIECQHPVTIKTTVLKSCLSIEDDNSVARSVDDKGSVCNIEVPIKFDLCAILKKQRNIAIANLNNDEVSVQTEHGSCRLHKIMSGDVVVRSIGGDITCTDVLQGNAVLETGESGVINISKPLCQSISLTTCNGSIEVKSLYAENSHFVTRSGNIHIGSAHRNVNVTNSQKGDLTIGSLDGSLKASFLTGNVNIFISRHHGVDISVASGKVTLQFSDSLQTKLDLTAADICIDDQLNCMNLKWDKCENRVQVSGSLGGHEGIEVKGIPTVKVVNSTGQINIVYKNWIDTLRLSTANNDVSD